MAEATEHVAWAHLVFFCGGAMFDRQEMERWWRRTISVDRPGALGQVARAGLWLAALPVEVVARLRNFFYDRGVLAVLKPPVPVISFGNITVGGTGKTPAVIWCAQYLLQRGMRPGIASRGYNPDGPAGADGNDEARLIAEATPGVPHAWDADRAAAAARLVKDHGCDVVILDDGFQHRRLHRSIDFALISALDPFGRGFVMPRGFLREPVSSLRRATCVIITHSNLVSSERLMEIRKRVWDIDEGIKLAEAVHRPTALVVEGVEQDPASINGARIFVFCGIGSPHAFVVSLANLGAEVLGIRSFGDHHVYTDEEVAEVLSQARERGAEMVVTTQKDRVKIEALPEKALPLAEMRVEFAITRGESTVTNMLDFLAGTGERGREA